MVQGLDAATISQGVGTAINGIIYIIVFAIFAAGGYLAYHMSTFKHIIRIREIINGRKIIFDDRAKQKNIEGVDYWILQKKKERLNVPPPEAIDVNHKGKKVVEAYRSDTGEYFFIKDDGMDGNFEEDEFGNVIVSKSLKPFSSTSKLILINQIKKANDKRQRGLKDQIVPIAAFTGIIIMVSMLVIFYGDMAAPLLQMADTQAGIQKDQHATTQLLQEIIQNKQVIRTDRLGD